MKTDSTSLADRHVVVIGGSSGIGFAIAERARALGAELLITGRDADKARGAADRLGGVASAVLDAHDDDAVKRFFAEGADVDHVISMVGDSMSGGFLDTTPETMGHVVDSKFWANWTIARNAAPRLRDGGSLTFTSGTGGRPHEISASYVANLAIGALVEGLAFELAPRARVNAVAPTFMGTETDFWREVPAQDLEQLQAGFAERVPLRRVGTAAEVADAYVHLVVNRFVTGQVLAVDGGIMLAA